MELRYTGKFLAATFGVKMSEKSVDIWKGILGSVKQAASYIPGMAEAIAGYDSYKRSSFERNLAKTLEFLQNKISNPEMLFQDSWIQSEAGQDFCRKVLDCAVDNQLQDKQELFVNALINGILDQESLEVEKLKFIDMLRNLSRASLLVLAEMHEMFKKSVRGVQDRADPTSALPLVDPSRLSEQLSKKFHPYIINAAFHEMQSQGLFSSTGEWRKRQDGSYTSGGGFASALCYTAFTYRFVEFISDVSEKARVEQKSKSNS